MNMACSTICCYRIQSPELNNLAGVTHSMKSMPGTDCPYFIFPSMYVQWMLLFSPMLHEGYTS